MIFYGKPDKPESAKTVFQESILERELINKLDIINRQEVNISIPITQNEIFDEAWKDIKPFRSVFFKTEDIDFEIIESKINETNQ